LGTLLGLSLYNQNIIELPFPLAVYKKLKIDSGSRAIADQLNMDDLEELDPEIATSLKNLIKTDFNKSDPGLFFSVSYESFGE